MTGPRRGANENKPIACPRSSGRQQSAKTPPPIYRDYEFKWWIHMLSSLTANGELPPIPAKNRNAIIWPVFWANPHPRLNADAIQMSTKRTMNYGCSYQRTTRLRWAKSGLNRISRSMVQIPRDQDLAPINPMFKTKSMVTYRIPRQKLMLPRRWLSRW